MNLLCKKIVFQIFMKTPVFKKLSAKSECKEALASMLVALMD